MSSSKFDSKNKNKENQDENSLKYCAHCNKQIPFGVKLKSKPNLIYCNHICALDNFINKNNQNDNQNNNNTPNNALTNVLTIDNVLLALSNELQKIWKTSNAELDINGKIIQTVQQSASLRSLQQ